VGNDGTIINTSQCFVEISPVRRSEVLYELFPFPGGKIPKGMNAHPFQVSLRFGAHSPKLAHRELPYASLHVFLCDYREAIGFMDVRSDLRQKLVGPDSDGAGQPRLFLDLFLYLPCNL
jgi:hypothetical protein